MCIHSKYLTERDCSYCIRMKESGPAVVGTIPEGSPQKAIQLGRPVLGADPQGGDLYDQFEYIREHDGA